MDYLQKHYSLQDFGGESFKGQNALFTMCAFMQTRFGNSIFENCMFIGCEFPLASFEKATFKRCSFKNCDFTGAFFDDANFMECRAYNSNFEGASFEACNFDFIRTDYCNFFQSRFSKEMQLPRDCREVIGEMIRQISDDIQIVAFSAFVKVHKTVCWEKFIEYAKILLSKENQEKLLALFGKYPNTKHMLEKWKGYE